MKPLAYLQQPLSALPLRLLFGAFLLSFISCVPQKVFRELAAPPPDLVWYQEDASEDATKADLEVCGSAPPSPARSPAGCMQGKGYLLVDRQVAELLRVRALRAKGLSAGAIAERLKLPRQTVETYLADGYQLPESPTLGRLPVEVLTKAGKPAVKPLIEALEADDPLIRRQAADALGRIGDPRAVEPLIATLKDRDSLIRGHAVQALGRIKDPSAVTSLVAILNSKDQEPHVRMNAAEALGAIGDPRAVEPLILALLDDHWGIRSRAALALGKIKDPRAVGSLIGALQDKEAAVRGSAAEALGIMGDGRAVKPLAAALQDTDRDVRKKAAVALRRLTGNEYRVP
jgi:HEAT repeat protein